MPHAAECLSLSTVGRSFAFRAKTVVMLMVAFVSLAAPCPGGTKTRLVEVSNDTSTYVGKVVARDSSTCVLIDRFGAMSELPIADLKSFKVVSESFKQSSTAEFRQQLTREFSKGYEVTASAHYVVCGKKGRAELYAELFEDIFRQIDTFYSLRGFETTDPDVSLVAIVFATQREFREYCERDQMAWSDTLRGYYSLKTNRVVLYDDPQLLNGLTAVEPDVPNQLPSGLAIASPLAGETTSTIIHETTHQVGFNLGIHSRIGTTPIWLAEGLATVLEAPGMRTRSKSAGNTKLNSGRLDWFTGEYAPRRQLGDLGRIVASDDMFRSSTLDAYSLAWAFTYFMTENPARARKFMSYLKLVSERDPLQKYTAEDRLKDFQAAFGDIARLEVELLRTMDHLESP